MKTMVATLTAAVLALAAGGVAQAGGQPSKNHDTHYSDRSRHDDHYRRDYDRCYEPCYEYPCYGEPCSNYCSYGEPCYESSCYPYRDYDHFRRSRDYDRGHERGRGPRK